MDVDFELIHDALLGLTVEMRVTIHASEDADWDRSRRAWAYAWTTEVVDYIAWLTLPWLRFL